MAKVAGQRPLPSGQTFYAETIRHAVMIALKHLDIGKKMMGKRQAARAEDACSLG
jgi:hypothetical protein